MLVCNFRFVVFLFLDIKFLTFSAVSSNFLSDHLSERLLHISKEQPFHPLFSTIGFKTERN